MRRSAVLVLIAIAGQAFATGNQHKPTGTGPNQAATARSSAWSTSASSAQANATAAPSSAVGGAVDASHEFWVLPNPVWVPPMAHVTCPTPQIRQQAFALLGGLAFSQSSSETDTRDCTAAIVINSLIDRCQYGRAQRALDLLAVRALPGFEAKPADYLDLTPVECAALKAPPRPPQTPAMMIPPGPPNKATKTGASLTCGKPVDGVKVCS